MRDYSKLSPFFWVRGSGRRLRGDALAQVVAAYLSTCPAANMVGIFYVSIATIADDTGHSPEDVRAALTRIEAARYAFYDHDAGIAWIPNHARFEIGAEMTPGDKRRKKVLAELSQVTGHSFESAFRDLYGRAYGLRPVAPATTPPPVAPQSEVLPASIPNLEGASGDREQDRAGQDQDRTGQDRGRGMPPERRFDPGSVAATEAREAFVASVVEATGRSFTFPRAPFHVSDLCDLLNGHASSGSISDDLDWLKVTVAAWVAAFDGKSTAGWQPSKLLDWVNGGRVASRDRGGTKRGAEITKQPYDPSAPWMKVGT